MVKMVLMGKMQHMCICPENNSFTIKQVKPFLKNTTITLTADSFNIINPTYKWYWAIAGTYDWQLLSNETNSTLVVSYNGIYFTSTKKMKLVLNV